MKPDMLCPITLLLGAAGWFAVRAREAETRSKRLGSASLACGVVAFIPAILGPTLKDPGDVRQVAACGVGTVLLAVLAVVLAIRTAVARRRDHGVGAVYPVAGLFCGAANLFCGAGIVGAGTELLTPANGTPWTWKSEAGDFEVTVPSERWTVKGGEDIYADFTCDRPRLSGMVAKVMPAATDAQYDAALAFVDHITKETPTTGTYETSGPNPHGNPHRLYMGDATADRGPYYFGISVTRVRGRAVVLGFEGYYRMTSDIARGQEARASRSQAELFLASVK